LFLLSATKGLRKPWQERDLTTLCFSQGNLNLGAIGEGEEPESACMRLGWIDVCEWGRRETKKGSSFQPSNDSRHKVEWTMCGAARLMCT